MFFNELNMLKYRLAVLNDTVDLFVIVEATHTHSGKPKDLFLRDHFDEFAKYHHKIIHVIVDDLPFQEPIPEGLKRNLDSKGYQSYAWKNENFQRNACERGLRRIDMRNDDRILLGDCDTIMDPAVLEHIKSQPPELDHNLFIFTQDVFCYSLNYPQKHVDYWCGLTLFKYGWMKQHGLSLQYISDNARYLYFPKLKAGWHLTYFGDELFIQTKLQSFAHQELNTPDRTNIDTVRQRVSAYLDTATGNPMEFYPINTISYLPPMYRTYLRSFFNPDKKPTIAVIVNSCLSYYKTTLPFVLKSATAAKIPLSSIYIVIGECDEERIDSSNEYTLIFTRYVNVDYNGIVYFTQTSHGLDVLKQYTHFFYMHDTITFMDHFWDRIHTYAPRCSSYIKLSRTGSKSTGLFSVTWFIENKKELFSYFANTDKSLRWNYKTSENFPKEELIRSKFDSLYLWLNEDAVFNFSNKHPIGPVFENNDPVDYSNRVKIYSDEERLVIPYKNPGIIKYQLNWDQPGMQWKTVP